MDQEHKTDSQERDALLREILDDTSPNRPAAKPPQRPPVSGTCSGYLRPH